VDLQDHLHEVHLFSQLRAGDLERLTRAAHLRKCQAGAVLALGQDRMEGLHVVLSGRVKLVMTGESGQEVIVSTRGAGDFFGETSLLDDLPLTTAAVAMDDSELLVLNRSAFLACLDDIPEMTYGLLRAMCTRIREADRRIGQLTRLEVPQRVAALLLDLADEHGGTCVVEPPTQAVMAQMVGTARETVARIMPRLASKGLIEVAREKVPIDERRETKASGNAVRTRRVILIKDRERLLAEAGEGERPPA
jgi:CRP/FNR family cyclic AMP-dependent transcriptional regulator